MKIYDSKGGWVNKGGKIEYVYIRNIQFKFNSNKNYIEPLLYCTNNVIDIIERTMFISGLEYEIIKHGIRIQIKCYLHTWKEFNKMVEVLIALGQTYTDDAIGMKRIKEFFKQ